MKKDNRGFTLIELLVVVAIMGILAGIVATSTSITAGARAKSCATQITDYIARTRIGCLSRAGTIDMTMELNVNGALVLNYSENGNSLSSSTVSASGVTVSFNGTTLTTDQQKVSFNRSGALHTDVGSTGNYVITVDGAGRTYIITVTAATGAITRS